MKSKSTDLYAILYAVYSKHRRKHKENPDSKQMCCMWSTAHPPDEIVGSDPLCDIEDAFQIYIGDDDAMILYDMTLDDALVQIVSIRAKNNLALPE